VEIETKIRASVRDAVNRESRKPFYWDGLQGFRQLDAIPKVLHGMGLREYLWQRYSERKSIGEISAIRKEIERLSSESDVLREESGFTPIEVSSQKAGGETGLSYSKKLRSYYKKLAFMPVISVLISQG